VHQAMIVSTARSKRRLMGSVLQTATACEETYFLCGCCTEHR